MLVFSLPFTPEKAKIRSLGGCQDRVGTRSWLFTEMGVR